MKVRRTFSHAVDQHATSQLPACRANLLDIGYAVAGSNEHPPPLNREKEARVNNLRALSINQEVAIDPDNMLHKAAL